jgi:hypothetical protein
MAFEDLHDANGTYGSAHPSFEVDVTEISSKVLARIVEEVKNDDISVAHSYDRTHNRHNR